MASHLMMSPVCWHRGWLVTKKRLIDLGFVFDTPGSTELTITQIEVALRAKYPSLDRLSCERGGCPTRTHLPIPRVSMASHLLANPGCLDAWKKNGLKV